MMSDHTKAVLELVAFLIAAILAAAAIVLVGVLWCVLQAIALLGTTFIAIVAGGINA